MNTDDSLLNIKDASNLLGVHKETLRRWDRKGLIKSVKIGTRGDRRFRRSDILKIVKSVSK